jgi:hypothetical protein
MKVIKKYQQKSDFKLDKVQKKDNETAPLNDDKKESMTKEMNDALVKADYELAQLQKADNEMAIQMAKESNPKGMNTILKKTLIALGVIGVVIGVYLLIKKNKK